MENPIKTPAPPVGSSGGTSSLPSDMPKVSPKDIEGPADNIATEVDKQAPADEPATDTLAAKPRPQQYQGGDKTTVASRFVLPERFETAAELPRHFGRKMTFNPEATGQKEHQQIPDEVSGLAKPQAGLPNKPLPQQPSPQDYRQAAGMRFFKSFGREGPLSQKLLKNAEEKQQPPILGGQQRLGEPMQKGEIMQLMRLRHEAENKERFRNLIRHEIAKVRAEKNQRVPTLHQQTESHDEAQKTNLLASTIANRHDAKKQQITERLKNATSLFEQVLQKVFSGKAKSVPPLPEGVKAKFLTKGDSEWNEFFNNTTQRESVLQTERAKLSQLIATMFRGVFTKNVDGKLMMVADFSLYENDEVLENKFSQVEISDENLLTLVKNLNPGDPLKPEILQQLGQEFDFIKLVHLLATVELTDKQRESMLKTLRQGTSSEALKKIEMQLAHKREEDERERRDGQTPFVYAGQEFATKRRFTGRPKFFMLFFYSLISIATGLVLYIIFRAL